MNKLYMVSIPFARDLVDVSLNVGDGLGILDTLLSCGSVYHETLNKQTILYNTRFLAYHIASNPNVFVNMF